MPCTIDVLLEDKPGALLRAAGLVTAMGCNIDQLTVAPDPAHDGLSRMTLVAALSPRQLDLVLRKLRSTIQVIHAEEAAGHREASDDQGVAVYNAVCTTADVQLQP